jgi:hypothetical protein
VSTGKPAEVRFTQIEDETGIKENPKVPPLAQLGFSIFKYLILLFGLVAFVLALYAVATYPRLESVLRFVNEESDLDALKAWRETRAEWFSQFKDMGQLFLVTPIVPLLGAVLGYIFGRQQAQSGES